jgi:metallo-beta-lactamase family protein
VHVIIVGYQAHGTLGRKLVDGATRVRVLGEPILVRATIHTVGGLSAHAGKSELLDWARRAAGPRPAKARFALTHGEDAPRAALAEAIRSDLGANVATPAYGQPIEV